MNSRFPIFMTSPDRIKTIEVYKEGDEPMTKLRLEKDNDDYLVDMIKKHHDKQKT